MCKEEERTSTTTTKKDSDFRFSTMQFSNRDRPNISETHRPSTSSLLISTFLLFPKDKPQPSSVPMSSPTAETNPKLLSILLKTIIMALIVSLLLLLVGLTALLVVQLCIANRTLRRHRRTTLTSNSPSGLSSKDLQKLPCFNHSSGVGPVASADCAVCLEAYQDGQRCRILPNCNHVFHSQCVDTWLVKTPICPICRSAALGFRQELQIPVVGDRV